MENEYKGFRWGVTFLRTTSRLSPKETRELVFHATEMYLTGAAEMQVKGENYEGIIYTRGEYGLVGQFGGQRFYAELDTNFGKDKAAFLVSELTGGRGAAYSVN